MKRKKKQSDNSSDKKKQKAIIEPDERICEVEPSYDFAEIQRGIRLLCTRPHVYEVRALRVEKGGTVSGYYDSEHRDDLAGACAELSGSADGVYVTLNPVSPDALARCVNRYQVFAKHTTGDAEIAERRWLPLDFDPVRLSGISSTDAEHEAALAKANECREFLLSLGFPAGSLVLIDSGNGAHLLCRLKLPNDGDARDLVKACIDAVDSRFSDDAVKVDKTTYNAARIWKVPGTQACKGDHTEERPHRIARIIDQPSQVIPINAGALKKLAALAPAPSAPVNRAGWTGNHLQFDLARWFAYHKVPVGPPKPWRGGQLWTLSVCPWNPMHNKGEAYVVQHANGAISARCHHDSCQDKSWRELRAIYEGTRPTEDAPKLPAWLANAAPVILEKFAEAVHNRSQTKS